MALYLPKFGKQASKTLPFTSKTLPEFQKHYPKKSITAGFLAKRVVKVEKKVPYLYTFIYMCT